MTDSTLPSIINGLVARHNNVQLMQEASELHDWQRANSDKSLNCIGLSNHDGAHSYMSIDTIRMLVEAGLQIIICAHDDFYEYLHVQSVAG